jgi:hypothetical protein
MLMERNVLTEQNKQGLEEKAVQINGEAVKNPKKKRSQSDKAGINRWNQQLIIRCLAKLEALESEARWIRHKMDRLGEADYSRDDVKRFSVMDAVDREIVQRLLEVGVDGALPKDVAAEVNRRGGHSLPYYEVGRRLVRLNKKLHFETGKLLFEKRGHKWALTRFAFEVYGASIADVPDASSIMPGEEAVK